MKLNNNDRITLSVCNIDYLYHHPKSEMVVITVWQQINISASLCLYRSKSRLSPSSLTQIQNDTCSPGRHAGTPRRCAWCSLLHIPWLHWNT